MEDRVIKVLGFIKEQTRTKSGAFILGVFFGFVPTMPALYIAYNVHLKNTELEKKKETDIEDCAERLIKLKEILKRIA